MKTNLPLNFIWRGLLAGIAIGIAALCFLRGGKLVGAALFAFGLAAIIQSKWALFTGACGFADYRKGISWFAIFFMLLCNGIGVMAAAILGAYPESVQAAADLTELRYSTPLPKIFGGAVLCGFIMTVSVMHAREGRWLPLILGIPTFVICGFPHCVADISYYFLSEQWGFPWLVTIAGNFIGCNLPTITTFKTRSPLQLS